MSLYHASFKGRRVNVFDKPLTRISVVVAADSIYDVEAKVKARYEFVTGVCVTSCDFIGREVFQLDQRRMDA